MLTGGYGVSVCKKKIKKTPNGPRTEYQLCEPVKKNVHPHFSYGRAAGHRSQQTPKRYVNKGRRVVQI